MNSKLKNNYEVKFSINLTLNNVIEIEKNIIIINSVFCEEIYNKISFSFNIFINNNNFI